MANYVLKRPMWTDEKMNRLVKEIRDNAKKDRKESEALLEECKAAMQELREGSLLQIVTMGSDGETILNADAFYKLINASTQAINQMGAANERLLKLATTMQKYQLKEMDIKNKANNSKDTDSVFAKLNAMANDEDSGD